MLFLVCGTAEHGRTRYRAQQLMLHPNSDSEMRRFESSRTPTGQSVSNALRNLAVPRGFAELVSVCGIWQWRRHSRLLSQRAFFGFAPNRPIWEAIAMTATRITRGAISLRFGTSSVLARISLAHVDLGHAVGIAGETHFVACQFRQAGSQARAGLRE